MESPASIANLGPAFDVAALAINPPSDLVTVKLFDGNGVVVKNNGDYASGLPTGEGNSAHLVASRALEIAGVRKGIEITIVKRIKPASGLGSSGATSAAVAYALNKMLDLHLNDWDLVELASYGELASAGVRHMDNVAASLFGGLVILNPIVKRIVKLSFPKVNILVVIEGSKPNTGFMRSVLPSAYELKDVVANMANVAQLVVAVMSNDMELFSKVVVNDRVAMPYRIKLYGHWNIVSEVLRKYGALAVVLSGAGPSIVGFYKDEPDVKAIEHELVNSGLRPSILLTQPSNTGIREVFN